MLRNLSDTLKGSTFPLKCHLEKGMCVELHFNGSIIRRGIVYEDPTLTMSYMWWQTNTRYVRGEIPKCTTLDEGIPKDRIPGLTIEPVPFFESWLASVPFSIRFYFGNDVKRVKNQKKKFSAAPPNAAVSQPVLSPQSSATQQQQESTPNVQDPPWTPPHYIPPTEKKSSSTTPVPVAQHMRMSLYY